MENYEEYTVFTVTAADGREAELAVVDEFEVEGTAYVAASLVVDDTISDEGVYLYKVKTTEPELEVDKISDEAEYNRVAEAYAAME